MPNSAMVSLRSSLESTRPYLPPHRPLSPAPPLPLNLDDSMPSINFGEFSLTEDTIPLSLLRDVLKSNVSTPIPDKGQTRSWDHGDKSSKEVSPLAPITSRLGEHRLPLADLNNHTVQPSGLYSHKEKEIPSATQILSTPPPMTKHDRNTSTPNTFPVIHSVASQHCIPSGYAEQPSTAESLPYTEVFDLSSYTAHQSLSFDTSEDSIVISPLHKTRRSPDLAESCEPTPLSSPDLDNSLTHGDTSFCFGAQALLGLTGDHKPSDFLPRLHSTGRRSRSLIVAPTTPPLNGSKARINHNKRLSSPSSSTFFSRGTINGVLDELHQAFHDFSFTDELAMTREREAHDTGMDDYAWSRVLATLA